MELISTTRIKSSLYTRGYKRKWAIGTISDEQVLASEGIIDNLMMITKEGYEMCMAAIHRGVADGLIEV